MRRRPLSWGFATVVALALLVGTLVADEWSMEAARAGGAYYTAATSNEHGVFVVTRMVVEPGDILRVQMHEPGTGTWSLLVTESGGANALIAGGMPATVYVEIPHTGIGGVLNFERPAVPEGKAPTTKLDATSSDGEAWPGNLSGDDALNALDVTWMRTDIAGPCDGSAARCESIEDSYVLNAAMLGAEYRRATVWEPERMAVQPAFYAAEALAGLGAAAFAVTGLVQVARQRGASHGGGATSTLVGVARSAEAYLVTLRNALLAVGLLLLALGFFGALGLEELVFYADALKPSEVWLRVLTGGLLGTFVLIVLLWAGGLVLCQRELMRFRREARRPPLGL